MGFREHILNLFTGPYVPFRHIMFSHGGFPFIPKTLTFTNCFHDRKGKTALYPHADQIDHNIISCTDGCGNGSLSLFNKSLGITKPYVCTMGKSCNTHQIRKIFRLGVNKHLHGKVCTKLRNSQTSKFTSFNIFRFDSQCIRTCKK